MNCTDAAITVKQVAGLDLLSGESVNGNLSLDKYGVAVIKTDIG